LQGSERKCLNALLSKALSIEYLVRLKSGSRIFIRIGRKGVKIMEIAKTGYFVGVYAAKALKRGMNTNIRGLI